LLRFLCRIKISQGVDARPAGIVLIAGGSRPERDIGIGGSGVKSEAGGCGQLETGAVASVEQADNRSVKTAAASGVFTDRVIAFSPQLIAFGFGRGQRRRQRLAPAFNSERALQRLRQLFLERGFALEGDIFQRRGLDLLAPAVNEPACGKPRREKRGEKNHGGVIPDKPGDFFNYGCSPACSSPLPPCGFPHSPLAAPSPLPPVQTGHMGNTRTGTRVTFFL
jgi:hypothetical protein